MQSFLYYNATKKGVKCVDTYIMPKRELYKNTINMAWPCVLECFLISLTFFFDSIMVSALGSAAIAAVGITTQPKYIGLAVFMALSVSVSALVARRYGENDRESANKILRTAFVLSLILVAIISVLFVVFARQILTLAGANSDTIDLASSYFKIVMGGIVFNALALIINAAQRGCGKTRISMITNISSNIVNLILNYFLIEGRFGFPALGVKGAAIATVIGACVGFIVSILSILDEKGFIYYKAVTGVLAVNKDIKAGLNIGLSAFIEQLFIRLGFFLFILTVATLGTTKLAANQIGMNFLGISGALAEGLSISSVALVGRSLGQKRQDLAKRYARSCQNIGLLISLIISPIYLFFGTQLFGLFSSDATILSYAPIIMNILCVVNIIQIQQLTIIGSLRGAGDTKFTAVTSFISIGIIRPLASYIFCYPLGFGLVGIWMGLFMDQITRFTLGYLRFKQGKWLKLKF